MKLLKKSILGLTTILAATAPIAAVVSCGGKSTKEALAMGGSGEGGTLSLAIRAEDYDSFKTVLAEFGKATGIQVQPKTMTGAPDGELRNWAIGNKIPDVSLAGSAFVEEANKKGWFQPLDLHELMTNPAYSDYNDKLSDDYKLKTGADFNDATFDLKAAEKVKQPSTHSRVSNKHMMLPTIKGMSTFYAWTKYNDGNPIYLPESQRSTAPEIKWYVPNGHGGTAEVTDFEAQNATPATSPLVYNDGTSDKHFRLTQEDVQRFIFGSAFESQRDFNLNKVNHSGDTIDTALARINLSASGDIYSDPKDAVLSTGTYGMLQRLYAVQRTIFEESKKHQGGRYNFVEPKAISTSDPIFSPITEYTTFYNKSVNPFMDNNDHYDDQATVGDKASNYAEQLYPRNGVNLGDKLIKLTYLTEGLNRIDTTISKDEDLAHKKSIFMVGYKWNHPGFEAASDRAEKGHIHGGLTAFALPYTSVSVEGYAMKRGLPTSQQKIAKKLLRFLAQPRVQAIISHNNAIPIVNKATDLMDDIYGQPTYVDKAFSKMGVPTQGKGTLYNGETVLEGQIKFFNSVSSSRGRLARWSAQAVEAQYGDASGYITPNGLKTKLDGMASKFWSNEDVNGA